MELGLYQVRDRLGLILPPQGLEVTGHLAVGGDAARVRLYFGDDL